jgi:hypothetical protein
LPGDLGWLGPRGASDPSGGQVRKSICGISHGLGYCHNTIVDY